MRPFLAALPSLLSAGFAFWLSRQELQNVKDNHFGLGLCCGGAVVMALRDAERAE